MATGPRKLSFAKLIKALNIDKERADFLDAHSSDTAKEELFSRINDLQQTSPGDFSRLFEVVQDINENGTPDQLTEALADEIYGREPAEPKKKTGIRGKTDAPPERIESVGAATDKADKGALPDTPPATPAAAEKPKRGRPRKAAPAAEAPAAETPAPAPANPNAPMDVGFDATADSYTGMPAAPNFSMDTSPAAMQAADPMGLGVDRLLLQQYLQQPPAGAFPSAVNNAPAATGMPQGMNMPMPLAEPTPQRTDIPAPAMPSGVGRPTEPPTGMSIDEQIAALEALSPQFSAPQSAPQSAPLSGLLDAVEAPQGAGTLPGVSLSPENDPTNFYNYPPPQGGGGGGGGPPNDPPKTMIGALRDMIARNPKKTALGAAALGGYAYFNQPQPNPNAPTEEEAMGDDAALQKAMDELRTIQGPPLPVGLPPRR